MGGKPAFYRDQRAWRELQCFLPERLRLTDETAPEEDFWDWRGHRVHLDRYPKPDAKAKVVLLHGLGTNGRQLSLILGAPLAQRGYETVAPDNLGFGLTQVESGTTFSYDDWVRLVVDFLLHERARDDRPIILYGQSAGGMLTYQVAARAPRGTVAGIVGMAFLDQRDRRVRDETAHDRLTARVGAPIIERLARTPLAAVRYPMSLASKMSALANDPRAMKVFMRDRTSAASWVSLRFLDGYMNYTPEVEPEDFDACPVLLTQPAMDRWTPLHLSEPFVARIAKVPVETVMLDNAGHYPMEEPGLTQMREAVADFVAKHTA
ncbi:alpha/beta hydrolase [Actinomadura logoneensis]|uniref:Alpha/beta hydrolase n=1 Tax=Actinomadura logoneensis TaxID=2293572 RepID=A0A372JLP7_9ACTN|nr:alpha/beta hydrolase [Actinomadura logoneensis]RFU40764.1 alpha/beta hydrolase [Actinomadura logoneensis]